MHRLVLLAALTACADLPAPADAPGSAWQLGPAMPRRALGAGVALLGQQIVVAGGFDTGASEGLEVTARIDAFDLADAVWRAMPDAPVRWAYPNLAAVGATLYLAGGLDGIDGTAHGEAYLLDSLSQQWRPIAAMDPADARGGAGVVSVAGRIYLLGGVSSTGVLATCLEYNIATDQWDRLPDLPVARAQPAAMRMVDGTLIVAGGFADRDGTTPLDDVWALPPPGAAVRTWQPRTAMDQPAPGLGGRGSCAYGVVLGELVCAGGEAGPTVRDLVESYDPYLDVWTVREAMPVGRAGAQGAAAGGRLFVPGGAGGAALEPTDTLYIYAPLDTAARL